MKKGVNGKKALGRGLSALFDDDILDDSDTHTNSDKEMVVESDGNSNNNDISQDTQVELSVDILKPNKHQPRELFQTKDLDELSHSIKENGVLQPLIVRPSKDTAGEFEIVAGERRWRASKMVGLEKVPVIVKDISDNEALEIALIENIQRADLNPIEEAKGFSRLVHQTGYTQKKLSEVIGKSRSYVANSLRLLGLPLEVISLVENGDISVGHAKILVGADNSREIANKIIKHGLNVRQTESLVNKISNSGDYDNTRKGDTSKGSLHYKENSEVKNLEEYLGSLLQMDVVISCDGKGKGELRIPFQTLEGLDDICRFFSRNES